MSVQQHTQHLPHRCRALLDVEPRTACGKGGNPWWLIARCDGEIVEYYRWWINRVHQIKVQRPLFGAHVSVMRGEAPLCGHDQWGVHQDQSLEIAYGHELTHAQGYWFLPVQCRALEEVRLTFGLEARPQFGFHLTIGSL